MAESVFQWNQANVVLPFFKQKFYIFSSVRKTLSINIFKDQNEKWLCDNKT